jgi:cytochrome c-type biogenesis protein CcmH
MSVQEDGAEPTRRTVPRRALVLIAGAALATVSASAAADAPLNERSAAARDLEGRLIAPCCWTQTLDIHDSPIADQLRTEIATRLRAGEPAAKIEDDLAARYGEKIRAVPRGEDPRVALPIIVGAAMSVAVLWLGWLGVMWLRRARTEPQPLREPGVEIQQYDKQLDQALSKLSDQD